MSILLVRHGETAGNATRVLQTPAVPLNERGQRQAACLAERLHALGFVHILCSDLLRAQMTAAPIAARAGLEIEHTPLLQERNFGDLRGTPYAELRQDPFHPDFIPPNGESVAMFHARVAQAFELIVARRRSLQGALLVVTHGLVCRALLERHAQLPASSTPLRFDNTGLSIFGAESPHIAELINCTAHLQADLDPLRSGGAA